MTNGWDAIRSGRPFRRSDWAPGHYVTLKSVVADAISREERISPRELEEDCWETKPAEVTITREKLEEAWINCNRAHGSWSVRNLARELGLE